MEERKQITFKLPQDEADRLFQTAMKSKLTVAEQVRRYVSKGMSSSDYQEEEAKILTNMQEALREVIDPKIDRLAKIGSKNAIAASIDLLITTMLVERLCSPESRPRLEEYLEKARYKGVKFVQEGKGSIESFLRTAMEELSEVWDE